MSEQTTIFTEKRAAIIAQRMSANLIQGVCVVAYPDAKNERISMDVYDYSRDGVRERIKRQIKTKKAVVYERGKRLSDSVFTGE